MKKRVLTMLLAVVLVVALAAPALAAGDATPAQYTTKVNGSTTTFQAYEVSGQVYLRLRDVAKALDSFNVQWADGSVVITTGAPYTSPTGSEMAAPFSGAQPYVQSPHPVIINGAAIDLNGILLTDVDGGGYNYFTPKALGDALGIALDEVSLPWAAAYAEQVKALAADDPDLAYALVYVDGDDVPELVADRVGFYLSLYTYKNGEVKTLLDSVGYGVAGNEGYTYVPRGNAIFGQYWSEDVSHEAYMKIGQNGELEAEYTTASADDVRQDTPADQTENPFLEGTLTAEQMLATLTAASNS